MSANRARIAGVDVSTEHYIAGQRVASSNSFSNHSPIDSTHLAEISAGGQAEADEAVAAARRAFPAWAALGPEGRLPILKRFAEGILARGDDLAAVECADNGALLGPTAHMTVPRAALNISYFAEFATTLGRHQIESPEVMNQVRYDPSGVSVLITPWNAPMMLTTWKIGPALAAGNSIVVKPPEWAPLSCSLLADIAEQAGVPAGVFNVVQGLGNQAGAALVQNPDVNRISFTGSTKTAQFIGAAASQSITATSMELGGKSPLIVFADADLAAAAQTVAMQYMNAGQVCLAGTRIFVEESIADAFLARVREIVAGLQVGDPRDPATRVGPLIHPVHYQRVEGFVERARSEGVQFLWGGARHRAGELYFEPTMIAGVSRDQEIFQSEVFGPVLIWNTFRSEDEVVEIANATRYGLAATIFTRNEARAMKIASGVVAGTVWVNCYYVRELAAPFGGARQSGIGREGGVWSFDFYCDIKNIAIRKGSFA